MMYNKLSMYEMRSAFLDKTMYLGQVCMKSIQRIESFLKHHYLLKLYRDKIAKLAPSHKRFEMIAILAVILLISVIYGITSLTTSLKKDKSET